MSFRRPSARRRSRPTSSVTGANLTLPSTASQSFIVAQDSIKPLRRAPNTGRLYLPIEPLVTLPGHRIFTQHESVSHAHTTPHDSPIHACNNASVHEAPIASGATQFVPSDNDFQFEMESELLLTEGLHISQDPLVAVSRNSRKKLKQWQRWSLEIIPSLIQPFLEYKRLSDNLRNEVVRESSICGNDCPRRQLKIVRVTFSGGYTCLTVVVRLLI
jgi:hypothetical protein